MAGWPHDPDRPFTMAPEPPVGLPPEVTALIQRAQARARQASAVRIPRKRPVRGRAATRWRRWPVVPLDPEYHALMGTSCVRGS